MTKQLPEKFVRKMDEKSRSTRLAIIDAALELAREVGYKSVTSTAIADAVGCSHGTVFNHFQDMENLRRAIMQHAVDRGDAEVVLQGIVTRSHIAMRAPKELQDRARSILSAE